MPYLWDDAIIDFPKFDAKFPNSLDGIFVTKIRIAPSDLSLVLDHFDVTAADGNPLGDVELTLTSRLGCSKNISIESSQILRRSWSGLFSRITPKSFNRHGTKHNSQVGWHCQQRRDPCRCQWIEGKSNSFNVTGSGWFTTGKIEVNVSSNEGTLVWSNRYYSATSDGLTSVPWSPTPWRCGFSTFLGIYVWQKPRVFKVTGPLSAYHPGKICDSRHQVGHAKSIQTLLFLCLLAGQRPKELEMG